MDFAPVWQELENQEIEVTEAMRAELAAHMDAFYLANAQANLTRVAPEDAPIRHVVDSLLVLPLIPSNSRVLDVGSGPGFPAWPIAWARPDLRVVALDSNNKMQRFLADHLRPNLVQLILRAEEPTTRESFDIATGRAVAPLGVQAELSAPWVRVGGRFIPFRTASERVEVESANLGVLGLKLSEVVEVPLRGTDARRLFPIYTKEKPTPEIYPRTWAKIKAKPLGGSRNR